MNCPEKLHNALINYRIESEATQFLWCILYKELDDHLYENLADRYEKQKEKITKKIILESKQQTMLEDIS